MATLPTADDLGFRAPGKAGPGRARTRRVATTAMDLKAVETTAAQKGAKEFGERVANEELAAAEVQFQIGAMAEAKKYENDTDFETIEERHAAGMQDQLGKASANITSAKTRALFIIRGEEGMARANDIMSQKVTKKKNDREKGYGANAIDLMVKGGMDMEYGDPGEAALGIQLMLDSQVERGVTTRVDAEATLKRASLDMAYGRLKQLPPKQQLEILNDPDPKTRKWVENIPGDVLRQLREQAEAQDANNAALGMAIEMKGMTEEEGLQSLENAFVAGELDDAEYEKTRLRFMRIKNDQDVQQLNAIEAYLEEGMAEISAGNTTIKQLEDSPGGIEMMKKMTQNQRLNLYASEEEAIKRQNGEGRKYSDQVVVSQLREYMAADQPIKMRKYWSENSAKLNMPDFKYFNQASSPTKSSDPKFKPLQTANQLMADYLDEHPLDEAGTVKLWGSLSDQVEEYQEINQKNPEQSLIRQWVQDKHANLVIEPPTTFLGFEFGGEEVLERDMTTEQKAVIKPITNVYQSAGMTGTAAANEFNAMSAPERAEFTRKRRLHPDMPAVEFLRRWKRGLRQAREQVDTAVRKQRGRGMSAVQDAGA